MLDTKPVPRPLHEVAGAVVVETGLRHDRLGPGEVFRVQHVTGIARAAVHFRGGRVFIQRPLVKIGEAPVVALVAGAEAKFAAARGPRRVDRERLEVIHVHHESQPDLLMIIQAGGRPPLLLRPGQGWQEQSGQDRDDGNDHQQFYQCETKCWGTGTVWSRIIHELNLCFKTSRGKGQIPTRLANQLVQRDTNQVPSLMMDTLTPPIWAFAFPFLGSLV